MLEYKCMLFSLNIFCARIYVHAPVFKSYVMRGDTVYNIVVDC